MILEGLVTTINEDGSPNISPMGPAVDQRMSQLLLRPYRTSTTYRNLKRSGEGVFHVTDDVELLARTAIDRLEELPALLPAQLVHGYILADACRWYAFRVERLEDSQERTTIQCQTVGLGRQRDFFGFNRAKHAVVEAAILATRVGILPAEQIRHEMQRLEIIVQKTAGAQEQRAFTLLKDYLKEHMSDAPE